MQISKNSVTLLLTVSYNYLVVGSDSKDTTVYYHVKSKFCTRQTMFKKVKELDQLSMMKTTTGLDYHGKFALIVTEHGLLHLYRVSDFFLIQFVDLNHSVSAISLVSNSNRFVMMAIESVGL